MKTWTFICCGAALVSATSFAGGQTAYLRSVNVRSEQNKPIMTVGDLAGNGYQMVGVPDGLGASVVGEGSFKLYMNHEFGQNAGAVHAHGNTGAFVSDWIIDFTANGDSYDFTVVSGQDSIGTAYDWDGRRTGYVAKANKFVSFCSAYLAGPSNGFDRSIFMTGEETPTNANFDGIGGGQAVAVFDGVGYTLPKFGRFSHEQELVLRDTGDQTVSWGMDDSFGSFPGHVFLYVGNKMPKSSDPLEINGLSTGSLYTLKITGIADESEMVKGMSYAATFEEVNWDQDTAGLHAEAATVGATDFVRLEDACYDKNDTSIVYFVTTGGSGTSNLYGRGYKFTFNDLSDVLAGGSVEVILDGTEGIVSPDNIDVNASGHLMLQEDPNYNLSTLGLTRDASIFCYDTNTGILSRAMQMDTPVAASIDGGYFPGKWETSGIIDASELFGEGWWLYDVQAHYTLPNPFVQGGQLVAFRWGFGQTAQPRYMLPISDSVEALTPILTVADHVKGYEMVGIPDGLGAYQTDDGTFRLFMNHEFSPGQGATHAHGGKGAFVSDWSINFGTNEDSGAMEFNVNKGDDLIKSVMDWDDVNGGYVSAVGDYARLCSAYLAGEQSGFDKKVFLTGEETGNAANFDGIIGGQSWAVIDGVAWGLPRFGRSAKENQVVIPNTGETTVVVVLDDSNPGPVWVYVGTKDAKASLDVDRFGLNNGTLYALKADGIASENDLVKGNPVGFSLVEVDWTLNGTALKADAASKGATNFIRIEDGTYDRNDYNTFYFDTTGGAGGNTNGKLHKLVFTDASNPTLGGQIEVLLDGSEGMVSPDNLEINAAGQLLLQEDPNFTLVGRDASIWVYNVNDASLERIVEMDTDLAHSKDGGYSNGSWESSGVIDASGFLGEGWWLFDVQAHYTLPSPFVQDGQLLALKVALPSVLGDLNGDGEVDGADLGLLLAAWESSEEAADLNNDGTVDGADLGLLLANWTG